MKTPTHIMIHHTAVSYDKNSNQFEATNNYHKSLNFPKSEMGYYVGYNYEIAANGVTKQARFEGELTAACPQNGMNDGRCVHIALDGHFDNEKPKPEQVYALRDLLQAIVEKRGIERKNIVFHNEYAAKSCPGVNIDKSFIQSLAFPDYVEPEENNQEELIAEIKKVSGNLDNLIMQL